MPGGEHLVGGAGAERVGGNLFVAEPDDEHRALRGQQRGELVRDGMGHVVRRLHAGGHGGQFQGNVPAARPSETLGGLGFGDLHAGELDARPLILRDRNAVGQTVPVGFGGFHREVGSDQIHGGPSDS